MALVLGRASFGLARCRPDTDQRDVMAREEAREKETATVAYCGQCGGACRRPARTQMEGERGHGGTCGRWRAWRHKQTASGDCSWSDRGDWTRPVRRSCIWHAARVVTTCTPRSGMSLTAKPCPLHHSLLLEFTSTTGIKWTTMG